MLKQCLIASALMMAGTAYAENTPNEQNPYAKPDDSWITLSGTVVTTAPTGFTLNYGDGRVIVEMDAPGGKASGYKVSPGDKVTVTGLIDDDLFETTSIEASSVYVEPLNTHFFSSAVDEEDVAFAVMQPLVLAKTAVVGTVTGIDGHEFTVNTGNKQVRVDTSRLPAARMTVDKGDRVSVVGSIDRDFFEGRELMAESIIALSPLSVAETDD